MSASTATMTSSSPSVYTTATFWERLWRLSGINFAGFFIIAYVIFGLQPQIEASADALDAFYSGNRTRILIAAVFAGMSVLNLLWFAAALRSTLADAGRDGWGAALTAASTAVAALFLLFISVIAVLAYSTASSLEFTLTAALNDFAWAVVVLSAFPRAMLIMSASFGLWRAGMISNSFFSVCVAALVLVLLGGTTWMGNGVWAPDGEYSRFISPVIAIVWVMFVSRVLLRAPATRSGW